MQNEQLRLECLKLAIGLPDPLASAWDFAQFVLFGEVGDAKVSPLPDTTPQVAQEPTPVLPKSETEKTIPLSEVKDAAIKAISKIGKEAFYDKLMPFGIIFTEGGQRKGDINKLAKKDYAAVLALSLEALK